MYRTFLKWSTWLALGLALTTASCDRVAPTAPEARVPAISASTSASYTLIHDVLPLPVPSLSVSGLIGINGGSLSVLGHTLNVPAGAVTVPTVFTMLVSTNGLIEVDLSATVTDILGRVINVGGNGFKKPVTLTLSYARSPDSFDPSDLLVVYVNGTSLVPQPSTVNTVTKTVTATLSHFSKYCMASN